MSLGLLKRMALAAMIFGVLIASVVHSNEHGPIIVGATVSLDGKYQETSQMLRDVFRLWEKQVNRRGGLLGRPVKLILYDDKSRKDLVKRYYEKLVTEDKVDLILSPYGTPLTLAASEVTERHGLVMVACGASGAKNWERGYRYIFGMYALAKRHFIGLLDLMARHGSETIAILYENSPFNTDLAQGTRQWAKRFGIKVSLDRAYGPGKEELPGLLEEVKGINPDGLILSAYPPDCYELIRLMKESGYRPRVIGMTIAPAYPGFIKKVGGFANGVFGPSHWEPDERIPFPGAKEFIKDYRAFTNKVPSYHATSAYGSCKILERAVIATNSLDHQKLRDFIASLDTFTVLGHFKVDRTGKQIGHNPLTIQWQNGIKEIVYPAKLRTAPAIF